MQPPRNFVIAPFSFLKNEGNTPFGTNYPKRFLRFTSQSSNSDATMKVHYQSSQELKPCGPKKLKKSCETEQKVKNMFEKKAKKVKI